MTFEYSRVKVNHDHITEVIINGETKSVHRM